VFTERSARWPTLARMDRLDLACALGCSLVVGCYAVRSSAGGAEADTPAARTIDAHAVALPEGYRIDVIATGLTFPTGVDFDAQGVPHVVEAGYCYGEAWATPRLVRVEADGSPAEVARGDNPPWNGVAFHDGSFFVAEGGVKEGGRILRIEPDGATDVLVEGLPSFGDHHTNGPAIGPDGLLYFGQGTATNSGIVGQDNVDFGWVERHTEFHDVPAFDVTLVGVDAASADGRPETGAFLPYGTPSEAGQIVRGAVPCTGAVMRMPVAGGPLEVVAWGLRNPFGLVFDEGGALFVSDNSYDDRGARPVWGTGDLLWEIDPSAPPLWFGWPDFHGTHPLTDADHFAPRGTYTAPGFVMASHPNPPPHPAAHFGVHASACGMDISTSDEFGMRGQLFVAQFGDMAPPVGKLLGPVGFKVVRVDPGSGTVEEFAVNEAGQGPASKVGGNGLERPVAVRFTPDGAALYVVDFGVLTSSDEGHVPQPGTGVLWRVTKEVSP
jgi:glucose/arabinose dehydrogenase